MAGVRTYISAGDFIDLYFKSRQRGLHSILSAFRFSGKGRTISKWDSVISVSDFWIIPEVHRRWNMLVTGDPDLEYEDYVVSRHFSGHTGLRLLSVGCGTGSHERRFARYPVFDLVEGIDLAAGKIKEARTLAAEAGMNNLNYYTGDFTKFPFAAQGYDTILFNSSLHHFSNIDRLLQSVVLPLLKTDGLLILFEYVGPDRLQWTTEQLAFANDLLNELPGKYRMRSGSKVQKTKIYRPGLLRQLLTDPSEAADSESILPSVHRHFSVIEEKNMGWNIIHLLLKDISHNFLSSDEETVSLLRYLFEQEDIFMARTGESDAVFGVYRKSRT